MSAKRMTRARATELAASRWQDERVRLAALTAVIVLVVVGVLAVIYARNATGGSSSGSAAAGRYPFQVGSPGPGQAAPAVSLPSTDGSTFDLSALRGQTVLLYFQEGVDCQPCWDQLRDIERNLPQFQALGIDKIVSITTDPLSALKQKVAVEHLTTPILSDSSVTVSKSYHANSYGMMGAGMDGHSFVLVNRQGTIAWRADYGGAPKYTMYVPVSNLLADIRKGLGGGSVQ